jgi:hypothetical protein
MANYSSYPRPSGDTGIMFHASANGNYPLGRPEHWPLWIARIKAMGGTWVKVLLMSDCKADPNEAPMKAIKALVDAGLEVVVRLFRERPNPGILTNQQLAQIPVLVNLGISYFESGNEPNLFVEWQNDDIGQMAREVVGRNWVKDAMAIVERGGWPGLPACSPGGNLDDQWFAEGMLAEALKTISPAVLAKTWWACHNYVGNHPMDFPFDDVNVNGTPVTAAEFARYSWPYGQTRDQVNAERKNGKHPYVEITDPGMSNCFGKYEMLRGLLNVPVISTEGGPVIDPGFSGDKRYPVTDLTLHAQYAVESARRMMWDEVPAYFFANCNWLLANRLMENPVEAGFESHSWWPVAGGMDGSGVPAVAAMIAMPKRARAIAPVVWTEAEMRALAEKHGQEIRIFTGGLLYKTMQERGLGYPTTNEWQEFGRLWQRAENPEKQTKSIVSCLDKTYNDLRVVTWPM